MNNAEEYVGDYIIDDKFPLAYFALIYLGALSQLHNVAVKYALIRPDVWAFHTVVDDRVVHWPPVLERYFIDATNLKTNSREPARKALSGFLGEASEAFLQDLRACELLHADSDKNGPFKLVQVLIDEAKPTVPFEEVLKKVEAVYSLPTSISKVVKKRLSFKGFAEDEAPAFRVAALSELSEFANHAEEFLSAKLNRKLSSIDMPGIAIGDQYLLKSRFHGLKPAPSSLQDAGLYYIVRQARGRLTKDPRRVGIIVRDLLWLRPGLLSFENDGVRTQVDPERAHGSRLGYYFSAIDQQVFEVTYVVKRRNVLMIDAVAHLDFNATKSLCLYLPTIDGEIGFSLGSMIGFLEENARTGAWTTVAIRPDLSQTDLVELNDTLSVYIDALAKQTRANYNVNVSQTVDLVEKSHLAGILFSKHWRDCSAGETRTLLDQRERAFARLFRRWEEYDQSEARVDAIMSDITEDGGISPQALREVLLELTAEEERHALTPPLMEQKDKKAVAGEGLDEDLAILCDRKDVPRYEEFMNDSMLFATDIDKAPPAES